MIRGDNSYAKLKPNEMQLKIQEKRLTNAILQIQMKTKCHKQKSEKSTRSRA
jgi:hypothetical protein